MLRPPRLRYIDMNSIGWTMVIWALALMLSEPDSGNPRRLDSNVISHRESTRLDGHIQVHASAGERDLAARF